MDCTIENAIFSVFKKEDVVFCYEKACELWDLSDIYGTRYYFYHTDKRLEFLSYTSETRWNTRTKIVPIYRENFNGLTIEQRHGFNVISVADVIRQMLEQKYDYFMQMTYESLSGLWELHNNDWSFVLRLCDTEDKLKFFNEIRLDCEEYYCD